MNALPFLNDAALEAWLATRAGHAAPIDLAAAIGAAVGTTPQVRRRWWSRMTPAPLAGSPGWRVAWALVAVGLLAIVVVSAALVGAGPFRRHGDLAVEPVPSAPVVEPVPSTPASAADALRLEPVGEALVSTTALGTVAWQAYELPGGHTLRSLTATPSGPVALDGNRLRWMTEPREWRALELPFSPARLVLVGEDLIASGNGQAVFLERSGSGWVVGEPVDLPYPAGDGGSEHDIGQAASGSRTIVLVDGTRLAHGSLTADDAWAGITRPVFKLAVRGPDKETLWAAAHGEVAGPCLPTWTSGYGSGPRVLATGAGFVALTPGTQGQGWRTEPMCEAVLWTSEDGSDWELVSPESPFGSGALVSRIASFRGRHVAVGNRVWVSDDGLAWKRLMVDFCREGSGCTEPAVVGASAAGWVILGWNGTAWTSADGRTWEPMPPTATLPRGGWLQPQLAVGPSWIVAAGERGEILVGTIEP